MPALDGVRGLAILLVLASHFFPTYSRFSQFGSEGVSLFFALSGYLITRVLLQYPEQPLSQSAGDFYFRRGLRLVPALYLAIAFGVLFDLSYMRQDWWIHGLYLTNFRVAINQAWGGAPHFWTLAVEEQFYLVWFFCVMTARGKWILRYIVIGLAIPFLFRATVEWWGQHLLPGQTDLLCAGALLAYGQERDQALFKVVARVLRNPVFLAAVILLTMVLFVPAVTSLVVRDVALSASVWLYAAIVLHAATARSGPLAAALGWAPLRHIGKISYGI